MAESRWVKDASELNREYYDVLTPGKEDYWLKMAAPRARVATFLGLLESFPPCRLADAGCGSGQLLLDIQSRWPSTSLTGLDLSPALVHDNRRRNPEIDWHVLDLGSRSLQLPTGVGDFDVVTSSEVIEHVDDPRAFLANCAQLVRPGAGRLLLSTQSGPIRETERRVGHQRHFSRVEMESLLRETGWKPVRVWNAGFPFHDLSKWYANRDPEGSMRRFGEGRYGLYERVLCAGLRLAFQANSQSRGAQLYAVAARA